jgi:hypothetical protein
MSLIEEASDVFIAETATAPKAQYAKLIETLQKAIRWLRAAAALVFGIGAGLGAWAFVHLREGAEAASGMIASDGDNVLLAVFLMFRTAAYAGLTGAVLFGVLTLGRACLDQATRYQKRLMAALFMHYALDQYADEIRKSEIKLNDIVAFIDAWSKNVESAFTKVRFGAKEAPVAFEFDSKTGHFKVRSGEATAATEPKKSP